MTPTLPAEAVYYDRLTDQMFAEAAEARKADTLAFAKRNGIKVIGAVVELEPASLFDGKQAGGYVPLTTGRPKLLHALDLCRERDPHAAVLVACRYRLTRDSVCLTELMAQPGMVPVLSQPDGLVLPLPRTAPRPLYVPVISLSRIAS